MEQVIPQLKQDKYHLVGGNRLNMRHLYYYLHTYLMPWVSPLKIEKHIRKRKNIDLEENAIKTFFTYKKVPPIVHYVYPLDSFGILPPCKRSPEALPLLWRQYNFPNAPVSLNLPPFEFQCSHYKKKNYTVDSSICSCHLSINFRLN